MNDFSWEKENRLTIKDLLDAPASRAPASLLLVLDATPAGIDVGSLVAGTLPFVEEVVAVLEGDGVRSLEPLRGACRLAGVPLEEIWVDPKTYPALYAIDEAATYANGRSLGDEELSGPFSGLPFVHDLSALYELGWNTCGRRWRVTLGPGERLLEPRRLAGVVDKLEDEEREICALLKQDTHVYEKVLSLGPPIAKWRRPHRPTLVGSPKIAIIEGGLAVAGPARRPELGMDFKRLYKHARDRAWQVPPREIGHLIMAAKNITDQPSLAGFADRLAALYLEEETSSVERATILAVAGRIQEVSGDFQRAAALYEQAFETWKSTKICLALCRVRYELARRLQDEEDQSKLWLMWQGVVAAYDAAVLFKFVQEADTLDLSVTIDGAKILAAGALAELKELHAAARLSSAAAAAFPGNPAVATLDAAIKDEISRAPTEKIADSTDIPWITVLTTPKRHGYLGKTLKAIDECGGSELAVAGARRTVWSDGDPARLGALPAGWRKAWCRRGHSIGTHFAMMSILISAARANAPYLLYFEDDVRGCRRAVSAMARLTTVMPHDLAFASFCSNKAHDREPRFCRAGSGDGFWGAQAIFFPGTTLRHLLTLSDDELYKRDNDYPYASDIWVGRLLTTGRAPWRYYATVQPSFFRHEGVISQVQSTATFSGYGRETPNYAGDDADAHDLLEEVFGNEHLTRRNVH